MSFADMIRLARQAARMTQRELAQALGVHHSLIGQWEQGTREPGMQNRIELSSVLGVRFSDLLPELVGRVVLVTDPDLVAVVRLVERMPIARRASLLRAIAVLLEQDDADPPAPPSPRPASAQRPAKAR